MGPRKSTDLDAGLRRRMPYERQRIHSQHTQLGELHTAIVDALDRDEVHTAYRAFGHFEQALRAHLEIEERIYFPAVHGLVPELAAEVASLVAEHETIREGLPRLNALLHAGECELSVDALQALARELSVHELREESLLARVSRPPENEV